MAKRVKKTVLFLCAGIDARGRVAEILFDSVADKIGMPWKASSRGLAPVPGAEAFASTSAVVKALESRGVRAGAEAARPLEKVTADDLEGADWIVALDEMEQFPQIQGQFPNWVEKVESWQVKDATAVETIEREVIDLTARLIGGGRKREAPSPEAVAEPPPKEKERKQTAEVRVGRETKGRRGKGVTTISDVPLDEAGLSELAARLKQSCGTGGTVRDGRIEIQGDQRDRLAAELEALGYRVKRV